MNYFHSAHPGGEFSLPPLGHGWLRGDGLFETMKTELGTIFFLDRHLNRLLEGATSLYFDLPNFEELRQNITDLLLRTAGINRGRMRITLFPDGDYLITHEDAPLRTTSMKLKIAPKVRFSDSALTGRKTLSYAEGSFGLRLAARSGCDDLLYLNERHEVVETGLANILIERRGVFTTPSLDSGCLPGVVRGVMLDWFKEVSEVVVTLDDLKSATGLYVLSSIREMDLVNELVFSDDKRQKFQISAAAEKLRADYLINSRSIPNS